MSLRKFVALVLLGVVLGGCSLAGRTLGRYYDDKVISGSVKHGLIVEHGRSLPSVSVDTYDGTVYSAATWRRPDRRRRRRPRRGVSRASSK